MPLPSDLLAAAQESHGHDPSPRSALRRGLRGERIGPQHVLVDYGCGAGRVLEQAARWPFGRRVGVEHDAALAAQARERSGAEVVVADARDWAPPDDVTHAYLYNPFSGAVLDGALAQLLASHDRRPRRLRVIYVNPDLEHVLLATGRLRPVRVSRGLRRSFTHRVCVYDVLAAPDPALRDTALRAPRGR